MIIRRHSICELIIEEVVLIAIESSHERKGIEGQEVNLTSFHSVCVLRQNDATLTSLCANQVTLLEGIRATILIELRILPQNTAFNLYIGTVLFHSTAVDSYLTKVRRVFLAWNDLLWFKVELDNSISFEDDR